MPVEQAVVRNMSQGFREMLALLLIGLCLYVLLAMATFSEAAIDSDFVPRGGFQNLGGTVGYYLSYGLLLVFGLAAYLPFLFLVAYGLMLFIGKEVERFTLKTVGVLVFTAMLATLITSPVDPRMVGANYPEGIGGNFGAALSPRMHQAFGGSGRFLLLLIGSILSLLIATEWVFSNLLLRALKASGDLYRRLRGLRSRDADALAEAGEGEGEEEEEWEYEDEGEEEDEEDDELEEDEEEEDEDEEEEEVQVVVPAKKPVKKPAPRKPKVAIHRPVISKAQQSLPFDAAYPFPPIELFQEAPPPDASLNQILIQKNAQAIERRLASFKIEANVVGVSPGPAVTQYEIKVAEGIKVSKIVSFEPDLAAALKAVTVRVVAPIPGKDTVGVEVPNPKRQVVVLRELLEGHGDNADLAIPLYLGRDVAGQPIVEDLARMPHLLIAGTTGSGKSVCINTILLSILMTRTPRQVRLILIDPKMVELQTYRMAPHLSCDVVTSMKKAPGVLAWAVEEMDKRYALLSAARVNHIRSFNKLGQEELEKRLQRKVESPEVEMSYQVLVIDELADLMAVAAKEVEESIQRLAQKSRAVGLHVVLATQRPSTDVITGVIKANLPCQIAFKVSRKVDSRVILDSNGAEKLLGHGDMLYIAPGSHQPVRAQGTFVSEEEIHRVVEYLEAEGAKPNYLPELMQTERARKRDPRDRDDLYEDAVEVILGQQRGSATLLQRSLSVGYTRATRLLELMEQDGIVGGFNGSKSREVMLTLEEWQAREAAMQEELSAVDEAAAAEAGAEAGAELEPVGEEDASGDS